MESGSDVLVRNTFIDIAEKGPGMLSLERARTDPMTGLQLNSSALQCLVEEDDCDSGNERDDDELSDEDLAGPPPLPLEQFVTHDGFEPHPAFDVHSGSLQQQQEPPAEDTLAMVPPPPDEGLGRLVTEDGFEESPAALWLRSVETPLPEPAVLPLCAFKTEDGFEDLSSPLDVPLPPPPPVEGLGRLVTDDGFEDGSPSKPMILRFSPGFDAVNGPPPCTRRPPSLPTSPSKLMAETHLSTAPSACEVLNLLSPSKQLSTCETSAFAPLLPPPSAPPHLPWLCGAAGAESADAGETGAAEDMWFGGLVPSSAPPTEPPMQVPEEPSVPSAPSRAAARGSRGREHAAVVLPAHVTAAFARCSPSEMPLVWPQVDDPSTSAASLVVMEADFAGPAAKARHIYWKVDARKLQGNDKVSVSPVFELPFDEPLPFKIMLCPRAVNDARGGASFRKAKGRGSVRLKCEAAISGTSCGLATFQISLGSGVAERLKELPVRGPVPHDFVQSGVGGLRAGRDEWDFRKVVDEATASFIVRIDIVVGPDGTIEAAVEDAK